MRNNEKLELLNYGREFLKCYSNILRDLIIIEILVGY